MDRKNFEALLMRHGVSEVAAANACRDFDNAPDEKAKQVVVSATLKRYKIGVKEKADNKSLATGDNKAEPQRARNEDGTFKGDDPSTPEQNEAFDPPKKTTKKRRFKKG